MTPQRGERNAMQTIWRVLLSLCLCRFAVTTRAQTYPDRPIRLIVSIAAGSVTDVIMRKAAAELSPRFGQQLVIENRGGASDIFGRADLRAIAAGRIHDVRDLPQYDVLQSIAVRQAAV